MAMVVGWVLKREARRAPQFAALSKYQASLLSCGSVLLSSWSTRPAQRRWLRRPEPYVGAARDAADVCAGAGVERIARVGLDRLSAWSRRNTRAGHDAARRLGAARAEHRWPGIAWVLPWIWVALAAVAGPRAPRGMGPVDDREVVLRMSGARADRARSRSVSAGRRSPGSRTGLATSGYLFLFPLAANVLFGQHDRAHTMPIGTDRSERASRQPAFARKGSSLVVRYIGRPGQPARTSPADGIRRECGDHRWVGLRVALIRCSDKVVIQRSRRWTGETLRRGPRLARRALAGPAQVRRRKARAGCSQARSRMRSVRLCRWCV